LFVAGAGLVVTELIFFPGHGFVAGFGVLAIVAALVWAMVGGGHVPVGVSWSLGWLPRALTQVFGALILAGLSLAVIAHFLPRSRLGRALVLEDTVGGVLDLGAALVGRTGVADTALRPTGKVLIDGRRLDVVSSGSFIEAGSAVEVLAVDGARITVQKRRA
jgi:membrane-bound serine protease (ClpP class)